MKPMQLDLLSDPKPYEEAYGRCLKAQWDYDMMVIRRRGILPPWLSSDNILDKDELALLSLIEDEFGAVEGMMVVVGERRVDRITPAIGMTAEANKDAVVNKCIAKGYVARVDVGGASRLDLTVDGRWRLDMWESANSV